MISIRFKHPPQQLFRTTAIEQVEPNWILLGIQPQECLRMELQTKEPGLEFRSHTTRLDAGYCGAVIENDSSLFLRSDEIQWAWRVVDPVLKVWDTEREYIPTYPAGTWGPSQSLRLFDKEDQRWRNSLDEAG